jgi:hypothetical protein
LFLDSRSFYREPWESWRYGIKIENTSTGEFEEWCPVAGTLFTNSDGRLVYQYIYKIPHNVDVGDVYRPWIYDYDLGDFPNTDSKYPGPTITIGAPYQIRSTYEMKTAWYTALFSWAGLGLEDCAAKDQLEQLFV